jgi:hypothetical protein
MAFMAHQPKALIYIEFKFKNEAVPPFQHMNECALTWLTKWHGEMLLHQEVQTLLVWVPFQDVYRPLYIVIPSEQANVGVENMHTIIDVPGV